MLIQVTEPSVGGEESCQGTVCPLTTKYTAFNLLFGFSL